MTATSAVEFLIWLLIAASGIAILAKRLRAPYTVALVAGGLILSTLHLPHVSPLDPGQRPEWLSPDVILILFLPALVFEGSVKLNVRHWCAIPLRSCFLRFWEFFLPLLSLATWFIGRPVSRRRWRFFSGQ